MRNIKLTIQYDGTNFHGWQTQPNGVSVQQVIEEAIFSIIQERPKLKASGRTDAGVHALSQIANFKLNSPLDVQKIQKGLNSKLPKNIVILGAEEAPLDFDAKIFAKKKLYRYYIYNSKIRDAFLYNYSKFVPYFLNAPLMKIAAEHLIGAHDFSAFRSSSCEAKTATRTIYKLEVSQKFSIKNKNYMPESSFKPCEITIDVLGSGFLKYMVRNIVGTLMEVGRGKLSPEEIKEILVSRDRKKAGPTAQPQGLFLMEVFY